MKLSKADAQSIAAAHRFDLREDFHALPASTVCRIIEAADLLKYRKPKHANGSRARYFFAYLCRAARRED